MNKPTLFLDVDGVVSPYPSRTSKAWPDWKQVKYDFNLELSKLQAAALTELPVNITWLTTWENLANNIIGSYFGWPQFPVIHADNHRWGEKIRSWWKYDAIISHLDQGGGPFIWCDDDIEAYVSLNKDFHSGIEKYEVPCLIIPTKTDEGLTPRHIEMIKNWCEEQ